jgi:hypothetical protein
MYRAVAQRPAPSVFIPATQAIMAGPSRFAVQGADGSTSQHFFTDQGDGRAFVQFGDGTIVPLQTVDTTGGLHLTTGPRWRWSQGRRQLIDDESPLPYYYVGTGSTATVRQVVVAGDRDADTDAGLLVGRFLASHDEESVTDDLNYYPEGVGLGWNRILDGDSVRAIASYGRAVPRELIVTSESKLSDLLTPIIKAHGLAVVWDPESSRVAFRPLRIPTAANAHAIALSDGNRTTPGDETKSLTDPSNVRSQWGLKWGWDPVDEKFAEATVILGDNVVASTAVRHKPEIVEDKTIWLKGDFDVIQYLNENFFGRSWLYRQSWKKFTRSLNRFGLTLAPGSYHQVIGANIVNPFTGRRGITAADRLYAMLISVTSNPQRPDRGSCTFLLNRHRRSSLFRSWSPSGLVDYAAAGHGYNTATGVLTMARRYSSHATNHDGWDVDVGDVVRLLSWHTPAAGPTYDETTEVLAVAADGSTVTVDSGLPAVPAGTELILVLQDYVNATAGRQEEVAFQGGSVAMLIEAVAGAELHRWA